MADGLPLLRGSGGLRLLELGGDRASTPVGADRCGERPRHLRHVHGAPRRRPPLPQHDPVGERNARPGSDGVRVAGHGVSGVVVHPPRTPPLGQRPCTRPRQLRELRDGVADAPALAVHGRSLRGLLHPPPKRSPARRGRRDLAVHGLHRRPHRHDGLDRHVLASRPRLPDPRAHRALCLGVVVRLAAPPRAHQHPAGQPLPRHAGSGGDGVALHAADALAELPPGAPPAPVDPLPPLWRDVEAKPGGLPRSRGRHRHRVRTPTHFRRVPRMERAQPGSVATRAAAIAEKDLAVTSGVSPASGSQRRSAHRRQRRHQLRCPPRASCRVPLPSRPARHRAHRHRWNLGPAQLLDLYAGDRGRTGGTGDRGQAHRRWSLLDVRRQGIEGGRQPRRHDADRKLRQHPRQRCRR